MKLSIKIIGSLAGITTLLFSCKKDVDPVFIVPPSTGAEVQFNGLIGTEAGSSAGNSVYLDLSGNKMTNTARASWDLGFYCGPEFRVILNNTSSAGAKVLSKNDLLAVNEADTIGLTLAVSQFNPQPTDMVYFDDIAGSITGTVIPEVSVKEESNNVIILNRGTGGSIPPRPWIKLRVLRNAVGGYTLQYAGIRETVFKTIQVAKNSDFHFSFVSIDNGIVDAQPEKSKWDLMWSYSLYQGNFGLGLSPYNYSDMIAVNHLSRIEVKEKVYANAAVASAAYTAFNRDSVNNTTLATGRWTIGSSWRSTQPATGARTDRFYIIKDADGNFYKFKCIAMGVGADGGVRGKPQFRYELIP